MERSRLVKSIGVNIQGLYDGVKMLAKGWSKNKMNKQSSLNTEFAPVSDY